MNTQKKDKGYQDAELKANLFYCTFYQINIYFLINLNRETTGKGKANRGVYCDTEHIKCEELANKKKTSEPAHGLHTHVLTDLLNNRTKPIPTIAF